MNERHASEESILYLEDQEIRVDDFDAPGLILDVGGGGEGIIGRLKGRQVVAIDTRRGELEKAPPGPLKIVMDARELKFLDGTFDTATAFFTLMYIREKADLEQVFSELFRVLRYGGHFLIWDAVIPRRFDPVKETVAFRLKVRLPDQEVSTGYGTKWPDEERNPAYYVGLAEATDFVVRPGWRRNRMWFLELRKPSAEVTWHPTRTERGYHRKTRGG